MKPFTFAPMVSALGLFGLTLGTAIAWQAIGPPEGRAADAGLSNLALNKPAQQSSTSQWSHSNDAQGAVDGIKNGRFGFHTNNEPSPWWQVDLQGVGTLGEIRIFNRIDNVPERSRTVQVLLSTDGVNWQRVYAHDGRPFGGTDGKPLVVSLNGAPARYVRLQLNETTWFHLDEVEVYGAASQAPPVGRSFTAQPRGPGSQALTHLANAITWTTTVTNLRGQNGQPFAFLCPPNGAAVAAVWGTDVYTDDSSVCVAAVHAGAITFSSGGPVVIEIRPGQSSYAGATRNGVVSSGYGGWSGSFVFVTGAAAPQPRGPGDQVLVVAYGKDETDGSDVGWNAGYPNPSFDDDPARRGLPNARWQGAHSWDGTQLCLSIKNLEAPYPPAHTLAVGYTVTLPGGAFEDGATTKTFVLYRYSGVPAQKEVTQCVATRAGAGGAPTGRSFTAQPRVEIPPPAAAPSDAVTWAATAAPHRGRNGQQFTYACPAGGNPARVWGTDIYTDDSSVCTAAVHTGRIIPSSGGTVTIEIRPGQPSYMGTGRNGILSESYGAWTGSFVFVGAAGQPQGRSYTAQPRQSGPAGPGDPLTKEDPLKKEFGESLQKMLKP